MSSDGTASELKLFKTLTNPKRTNFDKKSGASVVEQALEREEEMEWPPHPSTPPPKHQNSSFFEHHNRRHHDPEDSPPHTPRSYVSRSPPNSPGQPNFPHHPPSLSLPDDPAEKQGMLLELHQLERDGVSLTRHFTMDDSASDMLFELNRIRSNLDTANSVSMMTDALQLGMKGVEMANSRWGPVLQLDGWSNVVDQDRERFKRVLTKLYKKHWRRGSMMSPEAELAMLLGGSAFLHHFQHKMGANPQANSGGVMGGFGNIMNMFGGGGGGGLGMGSGGMRPSPPAPSPETTSTGGSFTKRPPMRRPNAPSFFNESSPSPSPPPPPPPHPNIDATANETINALREERAVLQAQLRQQAVSGSPPSFAEGPTPSFVVMPEFVISHPHHSPDGPHIEELG
jgi:hypothetical protein